MPQRFYVYLLASGPCGWLYVGVTNDLVRRTWQHKTGAISPFRLRYPGGHVSFRPPSTWK